MSSEYTRGFIDGYNAAVEDMAADGSFYTEPEENRWEEVTVDPRGAGHTYRLKVPGGWLYRTVTYRYPELHAIYEEDKEGDITKFWKDRDITKAQEIISQTTVFVPEGL